jgi:hypothetical protein
LKVIVLFLQNELTREKEYGMELKSLSPEFDELRRVIISSNLTSCYLILNELALKEGGTAHFEKFRTGWIETYKDVYKLVSKMKIRKSQRI